MLQERVDTAIEVSRAEPDTDGTSAGSAAEFVDACAGRAPLQPVLDRLPEDLAAQVARAAEVL